jgi:hypothetical protein
VVLCNEGVNSEWQDMLLMIKYHGRSKSHAAHPKSAGVRCTLEARLHRQGHNSCHNQQQYTLNMGTSSPLPPLPHPRT